VHSGHDRVFAWIGSSDVILRPDDRLRVREDGDCSVRVALVATWRALAYPASYASWPQPIWSCVLSRWRRRQWHRVPGEKPSVNMANPCRSVRWAFCLPADSSSILTVASKGEAASRNLIGFASQAVELRPNHSYH